MKSRAERHRILLSAQMDAGGPVVDVHIRDVSPHGMMIRASTPPRVGTYVEVIAGEVSAVGRVRWTGENCFGIQTRDRIPIVKLVFRGAGKLVRDTAAPDPVPTAVAAVAEQHDRSRRLGRVIEFTLAVAAVAGVAFIVGAFAFGTLARPFATISAFLR
ncbi:MAG TPA: PilZ domain-containing protein [Allosphingosinicella sp.]|nr:PilZ domain-containing protein [Allosphingosinicella sp.]